MCYVLSLKCLGKELYSTLLKIRSANDTCDELEVEGGLRGTTLILSGKNIGFRAFLRTLLH